VLESLLAGAMALAQPQMAEFPLASPYVKQVSCIGARGTAFKVAANKYLSVNHVTARAGCSIEGKPIYVTYSDPAGDFSIISVYDPEPGGLPISCDGYRAGRPYLSVGFARGAPESIGVMLRAYDFPNLPGLTRGWQIFGGVETVIPGMSGGPILSEDGRVVGVVNAYNGDFGFSWSRALKDTAVCPHS
jgi:hypothetical protein